MKRGRSNGQQGLVDRSLVEYILPLEVGDEIRSVEHALVRFADTGLTRDLGSFCYLERENRPIRAPGRATKVVLNSFVSSRRRILVKFINLLSDGIRQGRSPRAQFLASQIFLSFLAWADLTFKSDVLATREVAARALTEYTDILIEKVRRGELVNSTASRTQKYLVSCLSGLMGDDHLADGLIRLRRGDGENGTVPVSEEAIGRQLAIDWCLFYGLRELVLEGRAFPFALHVPPFLRQPSNELWIFPTRGMFRSISENGRQHENRKELRYNQFAYDFENGRLRTYQECKQLYAKASVAKAVVYNAREQLRRANENNRCGARIAAAKAAMNAFVDMFIANTGMDWEQVRMLVWDDDYEVSRTTQDFTTVKARAGGAEVTFTVTSVFIPRFKQYLELRRWVLKDKQTDYLFFRPVRICANGDFKIECLPVASPELLYLHRRLAPELSIIGSREWRATKTNWNVDRYGTAVAAAIAQNAPGTVEAKYSAGTETNAIKEAGGYLSQLSAKFVSRKHILAKHTSPVGGCENFRHPLPSVAEPPVRPDCRNAEGCLFCNEHILVADEVDVRKLCSLRYCILHTRAFSDSREDWRRQFKPVLARIKNLLDLIGEKSERHHDLVVMVRKEVDRQGVLDPYWEAKMLMLDEISGDVSW